jgi:hypothetical protein
VGNRGRVRIDPVHGEPVLQEKGQVAPAAAPGVEDRTPGVELAFEELIEQVDVDRTEFVL